MLSKSLAVWVFGCLRRFECHAIIRTDAHRLCPFVRPSVRLSVRAVLYFYFLFFFLLFFTRVCTNATCSIFIWHQVTLFPSHAFLYTSQSRVTDNVIVFVASSTCANCFLVKRRNRREKKMWAQTTQNTSQRSNGIKSEWRRAPVVRTPAKRSIELIFIARV